MSVDFVDKSGEPPSLSDVKEALREWDRAFTNGSLLKIPSLAVQCSTIRAVLKIYAALMRWQAGSGPTAQPPTDKS